MKAKKRISKTLTKKGNLTTTQFWTMVKPDEEYLEYFDIEVLEKMQRSQFASPVIQKVIDKKIKENLKDIIADLQTDLEKYEARLDVEADPDQVGWLVNQTMYMQDQIDQYEEILNELK